MVLCLLSGNMLRVAEQVWHPKKQHRPRLRIRPQAGAICDGVSLETESL
jgi:hypothetical protein